MRYARHSINRIDTQRARFDLSTRSVPSVTSVKPLQHVFEYTGAKVLRARVVVTYSAWLYRGYTMGVQGMIFLTYVINEPRARSAVQVHMGGGGRVAHPRSILFSAQPPRSSAFVRARASIVRAIPPARCAHGGISCAHNRASTWQTTLWMARYVGWVDRYLKSGLAGTMFATRMHELFKLHATISSVLHRALLLQGLS